MPKLHEEATMEGEICASLQSKGWLYDYGADAHYDRQRALYPPDLIAWVRQTQPDVWETLEKRYGEAGAEAKLLDRVRKVLDEKGTLAALRSGMEMVGIRRTIRLAQFKPASGLNPEITDRYDANRLRVVQQVRYRLDSEHSIDLVLFLNGIPSATIELKTDFTQSVEDAVEQYRKDREPQPKGGRLEPLLSFPSGALVHFAVSSSLVRMTTKLAGKATRFLPFDRGNKGGAGNEPYPFGAATSYLWEQVLARDSWLDILGRYMVAKRDKKGNLSALFFPRYHQLDATRRLVNQVREDGAGGAYLIQHSAGSGKTASIAWTAHFLSELHDADDNKMFSTVIVVSDRRVIDGQLQDALFDFERTAGVVETIKNSGGAKSGQLAEALAAVKKIIVCTIQTFPYALEAVREKAATDGKTFAVIADEAHSSQAGMAAATLRQLLASDAAADLQDKGEVDIEDVLAAQMKARADDRGISFIAFTATPKNKTLELFGRLKDPSAPPSETNRHEAFHVYSMRQAIEEEFILDVLRNYTPYSTAFKLAQQGKDGLKEIDDKEVERSAATKKLMRWVRLHPHNIAQKVQITVEHFRENVAPLLEGQAKAMVVLGSRKEAVRWKVALDKYLITSDGASQAKLSAALQPVAQRLVTRFADAKSALRTAKEQDHGDAVTDAKDRIEALTLMKSDMQQYMRLYSYLSQMIDYGHTGVEKRYWFYRYLVPLLDFERENAEVDLSQVALTHHAIRALKQAVMNLGEGEIQPLKPIGAVGSGSVHDKDKAALSQIIAKVNALFEGDLTDGDQLSFVRSVKDKLMESDTLRAQARANSEAQFKASPTIDPEMLEAAIAAMEAHESMGVQVINSARVRAGLKNLLLNNLNLYDDLRSEVVLGS